MDSLSHLVQMLAPSGTVDLHCRFAGGWAVDNRPRPAGHVPYHVILQGQARMRADGEERVVTAGDVLVFPHGKAHTMLSMEDVEAEHAGATTETRRFNGVLTELVRHGDGAVFEMLCGMFVLSDAGGPLLRSLPDVVHVSTAERPALLALINMMHTETVDPRPGGAAVVSELSTALFTLVLRSLMAERALRTGVLALMADARLSRPVEAVLRQPAQPWTLATLADHALMSRATFARQFVQLSGMTPMDWVTQVRMELAVRLLLREKLTAGQVAERCGYASEAAFGRTFRQHHGINPGAYRRDMKHARKAAITAS